MLQCGFVTYLQHGYVMVQFNNADLSRPTRNSDWLTLTGAFCDNYRVSGALEKLEHETILQDRASDR